MTEGVALATAIDETLTQEPSFYVINLYTWLSDQDAATDLALRVADLVKSYPDIDELATTVSNEDDPQAEPAKVFVDVIRQPDEDVEDTLAEAVRHIQEPG